MLRNAIRKRIETGRLADNLNSRIFESSLLRRLTNICLLIDTGKQCTIAGFGQAFEEFQSTGILSNFTGSGQKPATNKDPHFDEASLHIMTFSDTYDNVCEKYSESKIYKH